MARRSPASTFAAQVWIESAIWWQGPPWFRPSVARAVTMRWLSPVRWSRAISPESRLYHKPCSVKKLAHGGRRQARPLSLSPTVSGHSSGRNQCACSLEAEHYAGRDSRSGVVIRA
jgi:hypothetical protein